MGSRRPLRRPERLRPRGHVLRGSRRRRCALWLLAGGGRRGGILRGGRSGIRDLRGGVGHLGLLEPQDARQLSRPLPGGSSFVEKARMEKNLIAAYIGDGYLYGAAD